MRLSLSELFSHLNSDTSSVSSSVADSPAGEDLFGFSLTQDVQGKSAPVCRYEKEDLFLSFTYFSRCFNISLFNEPARNLFELSAEAFDIFIHAWMSELPIEKEIISFARKVIATARECPSSCAQKEKRKAASRAVSDRGAPDTRTVLNAAARAYHEIHRMMGLLRFSPDGTGTYIARFEPDHFIIPALGEYFAARFGRTAWVIIDEKRRLCLNRLHGKRPILVPKETCSNFNPEQRDEWEELWKHYHSTINNESRKNLNLQRQLMPKRYWKYLNEV